MIRLVLMVVVALGWQQAMAGVVLYTSEGTFNSAVVGEFLGTEDWESSTLGSNDIQQLVGPLEPGVANGPFPSGTNAALQMTVQENSLGGNPTTTTSPGVLATASDGFASTPTDQLSTSTSGYSFDMLFGLPTTSVSFTPLVFDPDASGDDGTATIRVYNTSNTLIGTFVDQVVAGYTNPTTFLGLVADGGHTIGRVNIFATSAGDVYSGADNINVYAIPEPSPFALMCLLCGIVLGRRRILQHYEVA